MIRAARFVLITCTVLVMFVRNAPAQTSTWNGSTNDWNTAGNWSPFGVPSPTNAVIFTDTSAQLVNISASTSCQSITFNNPSTSYILTANAGLTLTVSSAITMNADLPINFDEINVPNLFFGASGSNQSLTVSNNGNFGASLVIGSNTALGNPGTGGVTIGGIGNTTFSGTFAASPNNVVGGLAKTGPGQLDYSGTGTSLSGNLTLNGGSLILDYQSSTASKVQLSGTGTNSALALQGGVLIFFPNAGPVSQSFPNGTIVSGGHTDIEQLGSGGNITVNAGAIGRSAGATTDFLSVGGSQFIVQTSTGNNPTGNLLGNGPAFATVNGGANWAVQSGVVVAGLAGFSTNIYGPGDNTDVTANANPSAFTTNSLRFNVQNLSLGLTGTNTLQSGGILVTPSGGNDQITGAGATLVAGGGELVVHQYSTLPFTIGAAISATAGLTKAGPGTLTLSGNNTGLTGPINVNRGSLTVSGQTAAVNSASAINFNDNRPSNSFGGLQTFTVALPNGTNGTITPPIRLSAFSSVDYGTYFSTGSTTGSTITLGGVLGSANGLTTSIRFTGDPSDTSGFNLTNTANTFTGNVSLYRGTLGIAADGSLGAASNVLNLDLFDFASGGLVFLNNATNVAHAVSVNSSTRIIVNGTNSETISGVMFGTGGVNKDGTGTLTITNAGNTVTGGATVLNGTLALGANALPATTYVSVYSGATFAPSTAAGGTFGNVSLYGGTFRVPTGNGQIYRMDQIVTNTAGGTVDFTGAGADDLSVPTITINGNSTWYSPNNATTITSIAPVTITVVPGVMFTNGIALGSGYYFLVTGGGTLYQNSDATNVLSSGGFINVAQGSTFRVTDASSNGGVGNIGNGTLTLDGGTFSFGALSGMTTTGHPITLTSNGGTINIEFGATTLVAAGSITAPPGGPLTKTGPGTLILGNSGNNFGNLTINGGTVQTGNNNTLGSGTTVTVNPGATLSFAGAGSTTTGRTINLNSGTLSVAGGMTLNLNGASVNGGFLRGSGTYVVTGGAALNGGTTYASTTISQTGAGSYTNFSNGGALTIASGSAITATMNGFTNEGSGAITLNQDSQLSVADFQTYGTLTLNPGSFNGTSGNVTQITNTGTSPMYFNGGSRTFISTVAQVANQNAGIDVHGNDAIVAGGLFVNNGYVYDSVGAGTHRIVADYGSLVKGAGFYQPLPKTINGGTFIAGNSPGHATTGTIVLGGPNDPNGGLSDFTWQINNAGPSASYPAATGVSGPSANAARQVSGWGTLLAVAGISPVATAGNFRWDATSADKLTIHLQTLLAPDNAGGNPSASGGYGSAGDMTPGPMTDFDPSQSYSWRLFAYAGGYTGPTDTATLDASTNIDASGFLNPHAGRFDLVLNQSSQEMDLVFTPTAVPEPGTFLLTAAAGIGVFRAIRRRRRG
jgi:autotransporter-associated beta strand protein